VPRTTRRPAGSPPSPSGGGCPFCAIVAGEAPGFVVDRAPAHVAFLDTRPLFEGHTLVVPHEHVVTLDQLAPERIGPFFSAVQRIEVAVRVATGAAGSFVALNNTVSQSVPHLHVHVVPRTRGDGLRGFFWPRTRYADDAAATAVAAAIAGRLEPPAQ
jgi:histidine triad (HIT) family protein